MTVAFSSIANTAYAVRVNTSCSKPTTAVGNLMIAYLVHGGSTVPTITAIPSGWTEYTATAFTTVTFGGFSLKLRIWFRLVDGSEGASFQWSHASANTVMAILNYTGVDSITPIGAVSQNSGASGTNNTSTYLTITPAAGACNTTIGYDWADTANNLVPPSGTPTLTERLDGVVLYIATADNVPAVATGSRTQTNNNFPTGVNSGWFASQLSINPAAAGAGIASKKIITQKQALIRSAYW